MSLSGFNAYYRSVGKSSANCTYASLQRQHFSYKEILLSTLGSVAWVVFGASSEFGPSAGFVSSFVGAAVGFEFFGFFLAASPSSVVGVKSPKKIMGGELNAVIKPELRGLERGYGSLVLVSVILEHCALRILSDLCRRCLQFYF